VTGAIERRLKEVREAYERGRRAGLAEPRPEPASRAGVHPVLFELFKLLPRRAEGGEQPEWPVAERIKWMRAAAALFDLVYPDPAGPEIPLQIQFQIKNEPSPEQTVNAGSQRHLNAD
jgi:hypothetical protein